MATERSEHQQWADQEIESLVELGFDLADAEARVRFVLDNLPPGADPATYIFPPHDLWQEPSSQQTDSAAAWMADDNVPPRFKRLLHARQEDE